MGHRHFFRWVSAVGLVLLAGWAGLYLTEPAPPALHKVQLAVLDAKADGTCRVRWADPLDQGPREATIECDRGPLGRFGWVFTAGTHRGELYMARHHQPDFRSRLTDGLLRGGVLLSVAGLVGGGVRRLPPFAGVDPRLLSRATGLRDAAARAAMDHDRAEAAVRAAWEENRPGPHGTELAAVLRTLAEAGPPAREAARAGRELARRLDGLLADAAPAAGYGAMLRAGAESRRLARAATAELRPLLEEAARKGLADRFARASAALARAQDAGHASATDTARPPALSATASTPGP
ncbi:hypothetical protein ABZ135_24650 [Streptomyces sp. NPDC006339]|uniref:hypothetical protein n=1 Tax=Streptomyces sp. NPDC006339 TaxID=3156755 RepID=UPI0033B10D21